MKLPSTSSKPSALPKTYAALVSLLVPRPIHDRATYDNAVEIVQALAGFKLNRDQEDYLELMARLVEEYERATIPEPAPVKESKKKSGGLLDFGHWSLFGKSSMSGSARTPATPAY